MKNKFLLLGLIAALFVLAFPLYADPGGTVAVSASTTILSTEAMVESHAIVNAADQIAVKEAVRTVAGLAVVIVGALLLSILAAGIFMPKPEYMAYDGPLSYPLEKRSLSDVLRMRPHASGSPDTNLMESTGVNQKAGELAKRTKSELLKRQVS